MNWKIKMKIKYTTNNQRLSVEINTESVKEAFKELAIFQEVFDEDCCQLCYNEDLQFVVRKVDGNDFYELKCKKCYGKLAFGQHKTGNSLIPKRKNGGGAYDNNKGWHKWGEK